MRLRKRTREKVLRIWQRVSVQKRGRNKMTSKESQRKPRKRSQLRRELVKPSLLKLLIRLKRKRRKTKSQNSKNSRQCSASQMKRVKNQNPR